MSRKWLRCTVFALSTSTLLLLLMTTTLREDDLRVNDDFSARLRGPVEYDDPRLLSFIRHDHLDPPSDLEYDLMLNKTTSEAAVYNMYIVADAAFPALKEIISKVFAGVRGGFFVEAGAVDGEFLSNTLALERDLGWTGLLVEADGDMYHHLLGKHRRAWTSHACLALNPFPHHEILVKYSESRNNLPGSSLYARAHGALSAAERASPLALAGERESGRYVALYEPVQCLPLASLLLALNASHVHFVSLDVEGAEPAILRSFAWDAITVDVWLVEHITREDAADSESGPANRGHSSSPMHAGSQDFVNLFLSRGYAPYPMPGGDLEGNYIFVRKKSDVYKKLLKENGIL